MAPIPVLVDQKKWHYLQAHIGAISIEGTKDGSVQCAVFFQVIRFADFAMGGHTPSRGKRDCSRETREHVFCEQFG